MKDEQDKLRRALPRLIQILSSGDRRQGDINNFIRSDSVVIIVLLTDEDDCSSPNPEVYNNQSETLIVELGAEFDGLNSVNYRCAAFENVLFGVDRYDLLAQLVANPEDLVYLGPIRKRVFS